MADLRVKLPIIYSQFDPQWSKTLLGFNTEPKLATDIRYDIYNFGCLLSKLAEVATYFGHPETPLTLNDKLKGIAGFRNGGEYIHGSLNRLYPDIKETIITTPQALTDDHLKAMYLALDKALPVVIQIDYNPKTVKPDMHYVGVVDYDVKDENNFTIVDPLGGKIRSLKDYLQWFKPSARASIEQIFFFEGNVPQPPAPSEPPKVEPVAPTPIPEVGAVGNVAVPISDNERNVRKSTQWDRLVEYLELEKSSNDALFEDAKRVVAGIKSRNTDLNNKLIDAKKEAEGHKIHADVLATENGTLKGDLLRQEKAHLEEITALKQSHSNPDKLREIYDANLKAVQKERDEALKSVQTLRIEISDTMVEKSAENGFEVSKPVEITLSAAKSENWVSKVLSFFTKLEK